MKISFRRDVCSNYMVIENTGAFDPEDFEVRMLLENNIYGLLRFGYEIIDGKAKLLYEISSKQSLVAVFGAQKISSRMLCGLVDFLKNITDELEEYLLDPDNIMLKKECIFTELSSGCFFGCYNPYYKGDLKVELGILFDELLSEIDYDDPEAVRLAYALNREVHKENFTIDSIFKLACAKEDKNENAVQPFAPPAEEALEPENDEEAPEGLWESVFEEEQSEKSPGIFKKISGYLKGRSFYDVVDDIDSGQIKAKIKESAPPLKYKIQEADEPALSPENTEGSFFEEIKLFEFGKEEDSFGETCLLNDETAGGRFLISTSETGGNIELDTFPFTIGKLKDSVNAVVYSPAVSRMHCRIHEDTIKADSYFFEDLNSKNGSYVNNIRVNPYRKMPLKPGDTVKIADEEYVFR